jgi:hypothetical protein
MRRKGTAVPRVASVSPRTGRLSARRDGGDYGLLMEGSNKPRAGFRYGAGVRWNLRPCRAGDQ